MTYEQLRFLHLITVTPCVFLGAAQFVLPKKGGKHRLVGQVYMVLMLITAAITLFMPAAVGPRLGNHFGFIHLFSLLALWSVPRAYFAIRRGDVAAHQRGMIGLYLGAVVLAGSLALAPGRYLHDVLFGN